MKKFLLVCTVLFIIIIIAAGVLVFQINQFSTTPAYNYSDKVIVEIPKGASFKTIISLLYENKVINSEWKFQLLGTAKQFDKKARAGEFEFSTDMTPNAVMAKIQSGEVYLHKITFPEGYTLKLMAKRLEDIGLGSAEKFMAVTEDEALLKKYNIPAATMEGYLYPDTYFFPKGTSEKAIIEVMLRQMQSRFTPAMHRQAESLNMTMHDVLTLASIVEKETGKADERPLIASVFHNRLNRNMKLESDPTAVYGVELNGGSVTASHVRTESPYNTYMIPGLPPTPIASPGIDSIRAVLDPPKTSYLYFVATGRDGGHKFSATYDQHLKAVQEYREAMRQNN